MFGLLALAQRVEFFGGGADFGFESVGDGRKREEIEALRNGINGPIFKRTARR